MSNPDDHRSVFKDPSDIEMEDLPKPNHTLKLQKSLQSLNSIQLTIQCKQCHIMAVPVVPQLTPMAPTVVSKPTSNDIAIAPIIPTDPLFPPCLQPQRPYHLGEDIIEVGRGTHFIRVEDKDDNYYWITCQMDYTGVEFST